MFKRVSFMVLAVLMLLTMVCTITVSAAAAPEITLSVQADKTEAERGDTVTFTYKVNSTEPWYSAEVEGAYDATRLTYVSSSVGVTNSENGVLNFAVATQQANVAGETVLATAVFKVINTLDNTYLNTDAVVSAKLVDAGDAADLPLALETGDAANKTAAVKIVCKHTGACTPATVTTHNVVCSKCQLTTPEACSFTVVVGPKDVAHGTQSITVMKCSKCTNTTEVPGAVVPHVGDRYVSNGNGTHNVVCSKDGHVVTANEACTSNNSTSCKVTCTKCLGTYSNPNQTTAKHNTAEHYWAPTANAVGMIQQICKDCGAVVSTVSEPAANAWTFSDSAAGAWYYSETVFNKAYGIFGGDENGKFNPDNNIIRGDATIVFTRMLLAELGISESELKTMSQGEFNGLLATLNVKYGASATALTFSDMPQTAYYYRYATLMASFGVITGYTDGTFRGENNITREELATLMKRFADTMQKITGDNYNAAGTFGTPVAAYTDMAKVGDWAKTNVEWVRTVGMMTGKDGNAFDPAGKATRAEIATLMMRMKLVINEITTHNVPKN